MVNKTPVVIIDGTTGAEISVPTAASQAALLAELELKANLTETQPVSVESSPDDTTTSGSLTGAGQTLTHTLGNGESALIVQITGTWSGIIGFEATVDGTTYVTHPLTKQSDNTFVTTTNSTNGVFFGGYAGFVKFRLTVASWTSGTAVCTIRSSAGMQSVHLESPLPVGNNNIGDVDVVSSALPTGAATSAKQDTQISNLQTLNSLIPSVYDYISLSYTGNNLTGVVFKTGGSGGTTVSTLTLAYSGSNLISVTKT